MGLYTQGFYSLHLWNGGEAWALDLNRRQYGHLNDDARRNPWYFTHTWHK